MCWGRLGQTAGVALLTLGLASGCALGGQREPLKTTEMGAFAPPERFEPVSRITPLPEFIPGLGVLYVDPATLPEGPFLGYDRQGKLVSVIYMIPAAELEAKRRFTALGVTLPPVTVDHTEISYNLGHPGVAQDHYHIVQWLVSPEEQANLR